MDNYESGKRIARSKWEARIAFLEAIATVTPEVLTDLESMVMPSLKSLSLFRGESQPIESGKLPLSWQDYPEEAKEAFMAWSEKYNFTDKGDWILQTAALSLLMWGMDPDAKGDWLHDLATFWGGTEAESDIYSGKDEEEQPQTQTWKRIIQEIKNHLATKEKPTKDDGWSKMDSNIRIDEQYEWLVMHIIKNYSAEQIAEWRNQLNRPEYLGDINNTIFRNYNSVAKRAGIKLTLPKKEGKKK